MKVLLRRNAEAVGNHIYVGGRVAHLDTGHRLLRRMPVANIVDLGKAFHAFVLPHAIEKIVPSFLGAIINGHCGGKVGTDRRVILPGCNPVWAAAAIGPIAQLLGHQRLDKEFSQCHPA